MITLFTTHHKVSLPLLNSIESWERLSCVSEVFVFSDTITETELKDHCSKVKIFSANERPDRPPMVKTLFNDAFINTNNKFLCYLNSDILLLSDFCEAFHECKSRWDNFQMIGQRVDWMDSNWIRFNKNISDNEIRRRVQDDNSKLHSDQGIDYFCFNRDVYSTQLDDMPDFMLARQRFDHYLSYAPRRIGAEVIDCTNRVYCIHHEENQASRKKSWTTKPSFKRQCKENNIMYINAGQRDRISVSSIPTARTCKL